MTSRTIKRRRRWVSRLIAHSALSTVNCKVTRGLIQNLLTEILNVLNQL